MLLSHSSNTSDEKSLSTRFDGLNRIESREGAFGGIGALMTQSLEMASDYGHHDLGKKITAVTAGIPIEQRKSMETAFRHFASIVVRKQLDVI